MYEVEGAIDATQSQQYNPSPHQMCQLPVFLVPRNSHQELLEFRWIEEGDEDVGGVVEGEMVEGLEKLS